jgi:hypothetical protein
MGDSVGPPVGTVWLLRRCLDKTTNPRVSKSPQEGPGTPRIREPGAGAVATRRQPIQGLRGRRILVSKTLNSLRGTSGVVSEYQVIFGNGPIITFRKRAP